MSGKKVGVKVMVGGVTGGDSGGVVGFTTFLEGAYMLGTD